MQHYTTRTITILARIYLFFPLWFLIFANVGYKVPAGRIFSILVQPSLAFYFVSFLCVLSGIGLEKSSRWRWGWHVFAWTNFVIPLVNIHFAFNLSRFDEAPLLFLISSIIQVVFFFRVKREVKVPAFLPRHRWWEPYLIYQPTLTTEFDLGAGPQFSGSILDISLSGCFIKSKEDVEENQRVLLKFSIFGQKIDCKGLVVSKTMSGVTLPKGFGVKFYGMDRRKRRRLKIALIRLNRIMRLYRKARNENVENDFARAIQALQSGRNPELSSILDAKVPSG